ncbi:hypothetical protein CPC08DRAFT_667789 [Agrocybe pediades]|nr:hypothetical protein CPC08DRAFT_667789 [Agrocybe pediades]
MQCTWQKLARLAFRDSLARPCNSSRFSRYNAHYNPALGVRNHIPHHALLTRRRVFGTLEAVRDSANFSTPPVPTIPSAPQITPGPVTPEPAEVTNAAKTLSSAELGRAAARAVRLSMQDGNLSDAYLIVNSVRYAGVLHSAAKLPGIESMENFRSVAIAFNSDVSPRLPSHALLHGLIRSGMADKASNLAEQMMSAGIRVRCATLEAIFTALGQMSRQGSPGGRGLPPTAFSLHSSNILRLDQSITSDTATQFALRLLLLARQSRQRRSHKMFKALMTLCVINGEIILASLLFGYLVRDWQARELQRLDTPSKYETPRPARGRMQEICELADFALSEDRKAEHAQLQFKSALQALAYIAYLLDRRLIPFSNITPILCSISKCPRTSDKVWVPDENGVPQYIEAYPYLHGVLERLIHSLPTQSANPDSGSPQNSNGDMMIPLARASYHTLLHYSLRHRRSIPMAETLLHHMSEVREVPLEPDHITKNIVMRSMQLMRKHNIKKGPLAEVIQLQLTPPSSDAASTSASRRIPPNDSRSLVEIARAGDKYALSTQIAHLTSNGRAKDVVKAVPDLLPGLSKSTYPRGSPKMSRQEVRELHRQYRMEGLLRAVELGPVVLTSILNALQKDGRTTYAEKVWLWAKEAEALSWSYVRNAVIEPWCLPVGAYTVMINVYAAEASKRKEGAAEYATGWGRVKLRPTRKRQGRNTVDTHWKTPKVRTNLGRRHGLMTYRALWTAANKIRQRLAKLEMQDKPVLIRKRQLEIPRADERFFNAILKIVGKRRDVAPRRILYGKSHYARMIRKTRAEYIERGRLPQPPPDPALLEVAVDMSNMDLPLPLLFQKLLIGRWNGPKTTKLYRRDRRPFAASGKLKKDFEEPGVITLPVINTKRTKGDDKRKRKSKEDVSNR